MSTQERTVEMLAAAVAEEMDAEYTLVYIEQGQTLPDDVVAAIVRGDDAWETKGGEKTVEWASEIQWQSACDRVDDLAKEIVRRWEREDSDAETDANYDQLLDNEWPSSDERQAAIDTIRDRDVSKWDTELINRHGAVLLRVGIPAMSEDAGLSFNPITYEEFLDLLGFEHTEHNLTVAADVVDNASPEYTVVMGYAMIGADLAEIEALPAEGKVELRNPHVWFGSPFTGSGWCGEKPFHGTLIVDRDDLRSDEDAFGYSWDKVVGGTDASHFSGEVVAVTAPDAADTSGE